MKAFFEKVAGVLIAMSLILIIGAWVISATNTEVAVSIGVKMAQVAMGSVLIGVAMIPVALFADFWEETHG